MSQYYLIEKSGATRQVWGPYPSLAAATKSAGVRHAVVTGDGLRDGQAMTQGELKAAVQSRRVRTADGSDPEFLA
jgi:hypothetical protein